MRFFITFHVFLTVRVFVCVCCLRVSYFGCYCVAVFIFMLCRLKMNCSCVLYIFSCVFVSATTALWYFSLHLSLLFIVMRLLLGGELGGELLEVQKLSNLRTLI